MPIRFLPFFQSNSQRFVGWIKERLAPFVEKIFDSPVSKDKGFDQILKSRYIVSLNTARTIEEAEVICLAESHNRDDIRLQNAHTIDALYRKGDLLLVEELSDQKISVPLPVTKHIQSPIPVKGWDCPLQHVSGLPWFMTALHSNVERNESMMRSIDEALQEHPRVFVIAGRLHLYDRDPLLPQCPESMMEGIKKIREFLKTKKSIVLVPKANLSTGS